MKPQPSPHDLPLGRLLLSLLAVCALLPELAGCHSGAATPPAPEAEVLRRKGDQIEIPPGSPLRERLRLGTVELRSVRLSFDAPAEVEAIPERMVRITPPLTGRVVKLFVRFGDTIAVGQPLLTLDSPDLVAAQSDYLKAKSALGQSDKTLARQRDLLAHGIGAQRDLEQAQTEHETTRSELDRATIRLRLLGIDPGALGQALTLRSPIAGRVVEFKVAQGDYRSDLSELMMTIADLSTVWVTAHVQEKDIRRVHDNSESIASFAAYPGEKWPGKVQFVGDLLDPTTRTISVRIVMPNSERRLRPGMFASVTFVETAASELAVPTAAIVLIGDTNYVFVELAPWNFQRRRVVPQVQAGTYTLLSDGVKAGERIVTENAVVLQ